VVLRTVLVLTVSAGALLWAQAVEEQLDLDELVAEALAYNPEIRAAQKRYEASRQRSSQESSLPDPVATIGYASSGNPLPLAGIGQAPSANAGAMLMQELPFPAKLKLRGQIAAKESAAILEDYHAVQLDVVARVKQAYYKLAYARQASEALRRNRDLLGRLLEVAEARYAVGKAGQQDVLKAQTELSILETRLIQLQQEIAVSEAEINSLLNRHPQTPLGHPTSTEPKQLTLTLEELSEAARRNAPLLLREQRMVERSQQALNLARKDFYPDLILNGGYYDMGRMPSMYEFSVGLKLPIFAWRKQRAKVNEERALLQAAGKSYEAAAQELAFKLKEDYSAASAAYKLMELYRKTVVPQASLALESSLAAYETGAVDFLTVLSNFSRVLEYEVNYYEAVRNYGAALARLEALTGRRLT
jgi:cobalt-zinc-cadmium efflux system outer membrane protein